MIKTVNFLSEPIIGFLGAENSALFSACTDIFPGERSDDGVIWTQYDENEKLSSVIALGVKGKTVLFTSEASDFEELSFILGCNVVSPDKLPLRQTDKKYLMNTPSDFDASKKGVSTDDFVKIKALWSADFSEAVSSAAPKIYRGIINRCSGAVIRDNGEIAAGGFASFCDEYAVITDVFTKEKYRGKGYGTALVNKLLKLSRAETVYLLCEDKNLSFYEKIGFKTVKAVYEYEI